MDLPEVVPAREWEEAQRRLHAKEKELTRRSDELAAERRRLPRTQVESDYEFEGPQGKVGHPAQPARPRHHLRDHLARAARQARPVPAAARMGASVVLVGGGECGLDFGTSPPEPRPGAYQDGEGFALSVFLRDGGDAYRTYFTKSRGVEAIGTVWSFLDRMPLGRQESWEDSPTGYPQDEAYSWWRRHDEYEEEQ